MSRHSAGSRMDLASDVAEIWKRTVDSVATDAQAAAAPRPSETREGAGD